MRRRGSRRHIGLLALLAIVTVVCGCPRRQTTPVTELYSASGDEDVDAPAPPEFVFGPRFMCQAEGILAPLPQQSRAPQIHRLAVGVSASRVDSERLPGQVPPLLVWFGCPAVRSPRLWRAQLQLGKHRPDRR